MTTILTVPDSEQRVLDNLLRDLNEAYPDKVIRNLGRDHKTWDEKVTRLYKNIGYESRNDFLAAYGFTVEQGKGGRPSADLNAIVDELISRYYGDKYVTSIDQLKEENPDLAPKLKNIQNKAKDLFGMSLNNYLKEKGVLQSDKSAAEEKNKEYKAKLDVIFDELKVRYEGKPLPKTVTALKDDNSDIEGITSIGPWIERVYGKKSQEFLTENGFLEKKSATVENKPVSSKRLPVEEKLALVTNELKEKIANGDEKAETLAELMQKYPDLPSETTLRKWTKQVFNQTAYEYFKMQGILLSHRELFTKLLNIMTKTDAESSTSEPKKSFYNSIKRFDIDRFLLDVGAGTIGEIIFPDNEKKTVQTTDGRTIRIKNRLGSKLGKIEPEKLFSPHFFDFDVAKQYILSKSEVEELMLGIEDTSDAWIYATPIVDPEAPEIPYEEAFRRYALLVGISHIVCKDDWLAKIIEAVPKKKDGTLHKDRVTRIASTAFVEAGNNVVYSNHEIGVLYAKTEDDDEITLYANKRKISEEELAAISTDFVSQNWHAMGLDQYISIDTSEHEKNVNVKETVYGNFRVENGRLFINESKDKELTLAELGIFDSVHIDGDEIIIRYPHQDNYYKDFGSDKVLVDVTGVHEAVIDMWESLLCFGGLYDYENWDKKKAKLNVVINANGYRVYKGQVLPSFYHGIGDPTSDCRLLNSRKYSFKDSLIRFAKYIEGFERAFDKWVEDMASNEKYWGPFTKNSYFMPGHENEPVVWSLYTFKMPKEYGSYVFPPSFSYNFRVEVLGDTLRLSMGAM